jgi:hypothetical protein
VAGRDRSAYRERRLVTANTKGEAMALRKFRSFIQDRKRPLSTCAERTNLKEETNYADITDAATVIIGSELSVIERQSLSDSFINGVKKMTDDGTSILAMVVAF